MAIFQTFVGPSFPPYVVGTPPVYKNPEEVRHAHVSVYVLYREAISWGYQRKIRADRTLFLCLIQLCSLPHSTPVIQFRYTQPIGGTVT